MYCSLWLLLLLWSRTVAVRAIPPPDPVQCNRTVCTVSNSYGPWGDRKDCHVKTVKYPTTEEELHSSVAYATENKLKLKVVSKFSHSIPKLVCPSSSDSLLISTAKYNSVIRIDSNSTVTADAGVALRDLIDQVEKFGLSLVAAPYWEGVSVAGMITTGAHGSSWWGKGGAVHDHVIGINMIIPANESEGYAKVIQIGPQDELLNAAKVSLGVLGVISKVKFSLEPGFKRSVTYNFTNDDSMEDKFVEHGKKHEFGDITWYPSKHTAVYRYDDRVSINTPGDGVNDFIGFQSNEILVSQSVRTSEKLFESTKSVAGHCTLAATTLSYKKLIANGLKNNGLIFTGYPVVGRQGKMQTSGSCLYSPTTRLDTSCAWDPRIKGLFFYESTAIFDVPKFGDFIKDVKKLRDIKPENFCGIDHYTGIMVRYIKASDAYLGQPEDSVVIDFNYYRADDASTPRLNEDIMEEIEQMAFFKYGARPHWGKNRNLAFTNVRTKYPNFDKFVAAKKQLDHENMLSSDWSDEILFGKGSVRSDGCAMEGLCVCSEDGHCSPSKGYFCKPGLVYNEARVCRYSPSSTSNL
ncbi:L-gulonolactone oxidase 3 [Hibiscus syriacus]|uniref:L-gulonolactone oxidase n=1 Tax=Hibiscus syriacus TaxID=106335 RepID=A0A6A3BR24_HIBSY|nr:L-gulonolactone oxidase 3-like [Hibiscus syriacus]KAE8718875.1 L-gulonolactone oxidase 3 [Hibiscus syriacus]